MTNQQINKLMMYRPLDEFLSTNAAIVGRIEGFQECVALFSANVRAIERAAEVQVGATTGKTDVKVQAEETLIDQMVIAGASLRAYARRNNLLETERRAVAERWPLRQLRDVELLTRARILLEEVNTHAASLGRFGLDEAACARYRAAVDTFAKAMDIRENSVADRKVARTDLRSLYLETDRILAEELDPMIEHFRDSDPAFYDGFRHLRVTKALGARRKTNGDTAAPAGVPATNPVPAAGAVA